MIVFPSKTTKGFQIHIPAFQYHHGQDVTNK